jgi:hypothetical protein
MFLVVPVALWLTDVQGVLFESLFIHVLAWLNNDLCGGDDTISCNVILAVANAMFNDGSLKITLGDETVMNSCGKYWTYYSAQSSLRLSGFRISRTRRGTGCGTG